MRDVNAGKIQIQLGNTHVDFLFYLCENFTRVNNGGLEEVFKLTKPVKSGFVCTLIVTTAFKIVVE